MKWIRKLSKALLCVELVIAGTGHPSRAEQEVCPSRAEARIGCETDFRLDAPSKPLADLIIRNQGDTPNCYAHTAALMYDAWGLSHAAPSGFYNRSHRTSPYWATAYSGYLHSIQGALSWLGTHGSCDQRAYGQWKKKDNDPRTRDWEYEKKFNERYSNLEAIWTKAQHKDEETIRMLAADFNRQVASYLFSPGQTLDLEDAYKVLKAPTLLEAISVLYQSMCNNSEFFEQIKVPSLKTKDFEDSNANIPQYINDIWNAEISNPQPIGIAFCSAAFGDEFFSIPRKHVTTLDGCDMHAVALIGRRWSEKRGQCEYLLRNSWGYQCESYSREAIVECEEDTKEVWVSADWLDRSVDTTVHLSD